MTTTPYHHGNLREALVEAAVEVVREGGPEALSLRELARRVGVSHAAAYRHFADREALVDAVAERAMEALVACVRERLATVDEQDPVTRARRRLQQIGVGYVDFALAEAGLFRLLFTAYPEPPDGTDPDGEDPYGLLNAALDELVAVGYLDAGDRVGADVTCWAAVHGFSVLNVEGPLRGMGAANRDAALTGLLLGIDRGLGRRGEWPELTR
ncbi:TetR/AcrR family transcriptional regulator [Nocardioides ganghwensis]|uniref:TetR/AcrR family transcriptional regulator n=1 Tax=Nocardioides ganghwensis TaxID=252230 RepID=A0A4Q2S686_9ACTN|nr:TetR/AcrR family transcriptional regulator [Nocardioides ganghwensis]MBD3944423.1 TetR/AcrR family transcriptional regulator [Nocardioides ganghwensis]RYB97448.1 TetR/AcrR family transcriptional regulator [Nocardioides ganghwensis]